MAKITTHYLLLLLLLVAATPSATSSSITSSSTTQQQRQRQQQEEVSAYALYSLSPFTVSFTSSYTLGGLPTDPHERGSLLVSTLYTPLKIVTGEFLMESFRIEMASSSNNNRTKSMQQFLDTFMTLDLQLAVQSVQYLDITVDSTSGSEATTVDGGKVPTRKRLLRSLEEENLPQGNTATTTPSTTSSNNNNNILQFQADFFTTAAFINDNKQLDSGQLPTSEQVSDLLSQWMESAFDRDKPYYFDLLRNSANSVLEHMEQLYIETNSGAVFDPSKTATVGGIGNIGIGIGSSSSGSSSSGNSNNNNNDSNNIAIPQGTTDTHTYSKAAGWTPSEKIFFTILVCVSTVSIAGLLLALSKYKRKRRQQLSDGHSSTVNLSSHYNDRYYDDEDVEYLAGRHADEIMQVLHASDRYLAQHRPDLLAKYGGDDNTSGSGNGNNNNIGVVPVAANTGDETSQQVTQRRYVTTTNPFHYLYGASYFHRDRQAVEQEQEQRRRENPMDNVELPAESVPDDELPYDTDMDASTTEVKVSGYLQSWFQRVISKRRRRRAHRGETDYDDDEEYAFEVDDYQQNAHNTSGVAEEYGEMACDQDPSKYDFAFSDFPRADGTPCLIYEETLNEEEEEAFLRQQQQSHNHSYSTSSFGNQPYYDDPDDEDASSCLTDDEFRRALRLHDTSQLYYTGHNHDHSNSNSHLSDSDSASFNLINMDSTTIGTATTTTTTAVSDEDATTVQTSLQEEGEEEDRSKFNEKLERLVAMRHRHYKKQRIVEMHREQRKKERAKQRTAQQAQQQDEMQKRDRLLRRHCLELDIQELEANLMSGTTTTSSTTPKPPSSVSKITPTSTTSAGSSTSYGSGSFATEQQLPTNVKKPNLHRRTSSEANVGGNMTTAAVMGGLKTPPPIKSNRSMDMDMDADMAARFVRNNTNSNKNKTTIHGGADFGSKENNGRTVLPTRTTTTTDVFRSIDMATVSPASSMTETGSTTAPSSNGDGSHASSSSSRTTLPLMQFNGNSSNNSLGSNSIRDGSSARKSKKQRDMSSASLALAQGFQARRSMSFGNLEEKKMDDAVVDMTTIDGGNRNLKKRPLVPPSGSSSSMLQQQKTAPQQQRQRSNSVTRSRVTRSSSMGGGHRRTNSSSTAEALSVHGIYAQFV